MNGADYVIVGIVLVAIALGFVRGFLRESIALLTWLGGVWLAWHYAPVLQPHLGGLMAHHPQVQVWSARILIFLLVFIAGSFIGAILGYFIHQSGLSLAIDRLIGLGFGMVKGIVIVTTLIIAGQTLQVNKANWWHESRLMPYAEEVANWIRAFAETGVEKLGAVEA